jgi:hypothetical protein
MPITGNQARLQVGVQTNWSTAVNTTLQVEFTQESLKYIPGYISSDALVGAKTINRMDVTGVKVEGDFGMIVNPDNIGLLLAAVMGAEASPAAVSGSAVYDHVFTPMSAVAASSLPKLTMVVDRIAAVFGYVGCKLDSMELSCKPKDYLRATFGVRGYDETTGTAQSLTPSTRLPFQFSHGAITVDAVAYSDIVSFRLRYNNNLENDLFVMNGTTKMAEIDVQERDITCDMDVLYSTTTDATRSAKFKLGATAALVVTFTSTEAVLSGKYYTLTFSIPLGYIIAADPTVQGDGRIRQTFSVRASESTSSQALTVTARDARATKWGP